MSTGLLQQLADYGAFHDEEQGFIDVNDAFAARSAVFRSDTSLHVAPRRRIRIGVSVVIAAAVLTILSIGVIPLLVNNQETPPSDTVVTTTPTDPVPSSTGVLGPGSWSVVATFPGEPLSRDQVADMVTQVETWPGVLDVSAVPDQAAWRQFTGVVSECGDGAGFSPCGVGIVVLATTPWMDRVAESLESEFGMEAITALDVPTAFWDGYVEMLPSSEVPLSFDPTSLGIEISTVKRQGSRIAVEVGDVVVDDDVVVEKGVVRHSDGTLEFGGTGFSINDLMVDGFGNGGAIADLDAFTELESPIGPRRIYAVAGLPVDAAVVTLELADGTRVWQRPVGGMALFVDKIGSMPERFRDYYDDGGAVDPDELDELGPAKPLVVLDRNGAAIMRIEDAGHGQVVVTDVRIDRDAISKSLEAPFLVPDAAFSLAGRIAFASSEGIMILDLETGVTSQLTDGRWLDFSPSLSPDGTRIAFVSDRDASDFPEATEMHGAYVLDIYVMDADGSNVVRLTDTGGYDENPEWSPDGTRIVFESESSGGLHVMDSDGSNVVNLAELVGEGRSPTWSPDGTRILFTNDRDLYVMDSNGSNLTQLTHTAEGEMAPAWSPDGTRIAFFRWGGLFQLGELYVMEADGSNVTRIDSDPVAGARDPAWSPDGQLIAYVRVPGDPAPGIHQLYVMDVDGSNAIQIANIPALEPTWSR